MKKILMLLLAMTTFATTIFGDTGFDRTASVKAATDFLKSLTPAQKTVAHLSFSDTSRVYWSNLPDELTSRKGIQMKDLDEAQRILVHDLLRTVLSQQGYQKVMFIIQYDEATRERLAQAGNPIASRYGNQKYWFTIFDMPDNSGIWAWKFEGHHISLNITYFPSGVSCTPMFIGVNPALKTEGPYAGYHLMFEENEYGKQLFNALSPGMQEKARVSTLPADADVETQTGRKLHLAEKKGVNYQEMTPAQQVLVDNIIRTWTDNLAAPLAEEKRIRLLAQKNRLYFIWKGSFDAGELHYYAIHTDEFIIEFTHRDGGIHHYHALWWDLLEDF